MEKAKKILSALVIMVALQAIRELLEWALSPLTGDSSFAQRMATMVIMFLLAAVVIGYARFRKISLSALPEKWGKGYIAATAVAAALLIATPSNFTGGYQAVLLLLYGSIVTPVYEELLFHGYFWNRFNAVLEKETTTYLVTAILFGLWHIGYMIPQIMCGNWFAVFTKLVVGLGYGVVLGFVRLKTKNCYSTILLHGVLNIFMV